MAKINFLGVLEGHERSNGTAQTGYAVYGADGLSPTVLSHVGGMEL